MLALTSTLISWQHRWDKNKMLPWQWVRKSEYLVSHGNMSQHSTGLINTNSIQRTSILKVVWFGLGDIISMNGRLNVQLPQRITHFGSLNLQIKGSEINLDQGYPQQYCRSTKNTLKQSERWSRERSTSTPPYPLNCECFMKTWCDCKEATTDMKDKGLPVSEITAKDSLAEQLSPFTWETVGGLR